MSARNLLETVSEFTLAEDFSARTNLEVGPDEFTTVEEIGVAKGETVTLGVGRSRNPLQAEGSVRGDIQDSGNADIDGKFRLAVVNSQNNKVATIARGPINAIEQTRTNSLDGYILPYTGQRVAEPYKVVLQLKTNSGTSTYSSSNSNLTIDGFEGETVR